MTTTGGRTATRKVVVVTGAARGIGRSICEQFAHDGQRVIAVLRNSGQMAEVDALLGEHGYSVVCDVTRYASVALLFGRIAVEEGGIDALINNAGVITPIARLENSDPAAWQQAISVNLLGAYHCVRAALPLMLRNAPVACSAEPDAPAHRATIINLSSGAAHRPLEGWSAYCASKAGLAMLTRSIHEEYGAQGISATGFAPGVVDTGMQAQIRASGLNPVSKIERSALAPASGPARIIAALVKHCPTAHRGQEIDARDPAVAALARA